MYWFFFKPQGALLLNEIKNWLKMQKPVSDTVHYKLVINLLNHCWDIDTYHIN